LTFKLDSDKRISDIKFKTFGCGSAIASSSVLTEMCKGKTLEEASQITNQDIAEALGGLPSAKMHCSVMGQEALEAAIHYYRTGGQGTVHKDKEGTIVCTCFNVTDKEIESVIRSNHLTTVEEVKNFTKAGGGCGGCVKEITRILDIINGVRAEIPVNSPPKLTTLQKIDKIKEVIQDNIRPLLHSDGGDIELTDINGDEVFMQFKGHCAHCSNASITQYSLVEKILKEKVSLDLIVKLAE
jgi:NifU-like protein